MISNCKHLLASLLICPNTKVMSCCWSMSPHFVVCFKFQIRINFIRKIKNLLVFKYVKYKCYLAFTQQYLDFNGLIEKNQQNGQKFTILGFPCNQFFLQEPGENHEIINGCIVIFLLKYFNYFCSYRHHLCPAWKRMETTQWLAYFWEARSERQQSAPNVQVSKGIIRRN